MMRDPKPDELWVRYLDGDDDEELKRALAALAEQPDLATAWAEDRRLDGALRTLGRTASDQSRFVDEALARLVIDADGEGFAASFDRRLDRELRSRRRFRRWALTTGALVLAAGLAIVILVNRPRREDKLVANVHGVSVDPPVAGVPPRLPPVPIDPASLADAEVVAAWDFEDGAAPKLVGGRLVEGPPRRGNRYCLQGTQYHPKFRRSLGVQIDGREGGLFPYDDDLIVVFDYWLGAWLGDKPPRLTVGFYDLGERKLTESLIREPRPATWTTVAVRFSDMRHHQGGGTGRPGDTIGVLRFVSDHGVQDIFFIDNVRVVRLSPRRHD
jgi:hypothetical protein